MASAEDEPFLTTRQVAQRCGTTESTVRYSARVGNLRGMKVRNTWRFPESEAESFCADFRRVKSARRRRRRISWRLHGTGSKAVWLLHFVASLLSVVTAFGPGFAPLVGYALGGVNAVMGVVTFGLWRSRRASADDVVNDQPVDADIIGWRRPRMDSWDDLEASGPNIMARSAGGVPDPRESDAPPPTGGWRRLATAFLLGTALYAMLPFALDAWEEQRRGREGAEANPISRPVERFAPAPTPTSTPTPTATATWTPTTAAVIAPAETPIVPATSTPPPAATFTPTATVTPTATITPTPTFTPTATDTPTPTIAPPPTFTPTPCDVDGCPDAGGLGIPNPDEGAAADPNQPALNVPPPTPTLSPVE